MPGSIKRYVLVSLVLSSVAIALSFLCTQKFLITPREYYGIPLQGKAALNISIVARIVSIDVYAGTVIADWYPSPSNCSSHNQTIVNIYFDPNLLWGPNDGPFGSPPTTPLFKFNIGARCNSTVKDSLATFRTVSSLVGEVNNSRWTGSSIQFYPRDKYFAQLAVFAQMDGINTGVGIFTTEPSGAPFNFDVQVNHEKSNNTDQGLFMHLEVSRSTSVKVFVFLIIGVYWLLSVVFLCIAIASLMWQEYVVKEMFLVPVATLFAFVALRANMPGAPGGFGALIDFVGVLPNTMIMSLSSAILLIAVFYRRVCHKDTDSESREQTEEATQVATALDAAHRAVATASDALAVARGALAATALVTPPLARNP